MIRFHLFCERMILYLNGNLAFEWKNEKWMLSNNSSGCNGICKLILNKLVFHFYVIYSMIFHSPTSRYENLWYLITDRCWGLWQHKHSFVAPKELITFFTMIGYSKNLIIFYWGIFRYIWASILSLNLLELYFSSKYLENIWIHVLGFAEWKSLRFVECGIHEPSLITHERIWG